MPSAGRTISSGGNRHAYAFTALTDPAIRQSLLDEFQACCGRIRKLMATPRVQPAFPIPPHIPHVLPRLGHDPHLPVCYDGLR